MLTSDEARQLDRFAIGSLAGARASHGAGARVARARGFGLEFQDFRPYLPGDDPRSIDWTIHARLRQLVVRVRRADAYLRLYLLVDTSRSMGVGVPDKLSAATRLAAVLGYIACRQRDAFGMATFDETMTRFLAPAAGRTQMLRLFEALGAAAPIGRSAPNRALMEFGAVASGPGLVVVTSDFFHEEGAFEGLRFLMYRGLTPAVVQVVAPEELNPPIDGDIELVDIEDTDGPRLVVDARAVAAYRDRLARVAGELGEFCAKHGLPWMRIESSWSFSRLLDRCVDAGLLAG